MKKQTVAVLLTVSSLFVFLPERNAMACSEYHDLNQGQVQEYIATLKSHSEDEVDQIFRFEALRCSNIPSVREMALKTALFSTNSAIRAQGLLEAMMRKNIVTLEYSDEGDLSKKQAEFVSKYKSTSLIVYYNFREGGCMSLYDNHQCSPSDQIDINGLRVDIISSNTYKMAGTLELDYDGILKGGVRFSEIDITISARIALF